MSRKILVTGGNGFIGRHTVRALQARGYTSVVLDRQWGAQQQEHGVEIIGGDIRDASTVTEAMAHVDGFIHLAGVLGTAETINNPRPAAETNIMGGLNVLEAAAQYKVHGVNIAVGNHWMQNTYSITKSTVERFTQMYRHERGVQVSTVRALNAYGEGQSSAAPHGPSKVRKIMPSFVNRALDGDSIEVYGDGKQIMDMIYVGDVADILVSALEHSWVHGAVEDVLEAGTGRRTSVTQIAQCVLDEAGSSAGITYLRMRGGEPDHSVVVGNPQTLRWGIGYDVGRLMPLEEGVRRTVSWFRAQRQEDSRFNAGVESKNVLSEPDHVHEWTYWRAECGGCGEQEALCMKCRQTCCDRGSLAVQVAEQDARHSRAAHLFGQEIADEVFPPAEAGS